MNIPDYKDLHGQVLMNGNRHYKVYTHPNSEGIPGNWHVYYDGQKVFVEDPAYAAQQAAAAAAAQQAAEAAAAAQQAAAAAAQQAASVAWAHGHDLITNNVPGNPRRGQQYWVEQTAKGNVHHYKDKDILVVASNGDDSAPGPMVAATGGAVAPSASGNSSSSDPHPANQSGTPDGNTNKNHKKPHDELTVVGGQSDGNTMEQVSQSAMEAPKKGVVRPLHPGAGIGDDSTQPANIATGSGSVPIGPTYTVVPGDTMSEIAHAHHMSLAELKQLNPQIKNASLIHPGEKVNLGGAVDEISVVTGSETHASFPTSSSYPPSTDKHFTDPVSAGNGGWGTGSEAADPVKQVLNNVTGAVEKHTIDPFGVKNSKKPSNGNSESSTITKSVNTP